MSNTVDLERSNPPTGDREALRPQTGSHLPALDGLRGIAVILVMLYHSSYHNITDSGLLAGIIRGFRTGWCGVDLFFVLSGFLITGILIDTKYRRGYFRSFDLRRTLRIFPLYYLVLAVFLGVGPALNWVPQDALGGSSLWFWLYGQNFLFARHGWEVLSDIVPLTHFWSLAVEEHFYLVWPAVIYLVPNRWHLTTAAGLALAVLGCRFWLSVPEGGVLPCPNYVLTPCRIDGMLLGAIGAMLVRGPYSTRHLQLGCVGVALAALAGLVGIARHTGGFRYQANPMETLGFSCLAGLFAATVLAIVLAPPSARALRPLSRGLLCFFGKYSYALYVFNPLVDRYLRLILPPPTTAVAWLVHVGAVFLVGIGCALASWHLLEKHFLRLKSRFPA